MPITNSSISSSEATLAGEGPWHRFAFLWVLVAVGLTGVTLAATYAVDPYDTGRSVLFAKPGVRPQGPRTAGASRGRDPAFGAAIFGNSHIQLLSPERLSAATGLSFVQLSVPGTGPKEQFALIDWFLRHHARPRAIVIGADDFWCVDRPGLANDNPFPFWLYSRSALEYGRGLMRYNIIEEIPRRLAYFFARNPERARPDGYWDYEAAGYVGTADLGAAAIRARLDQPISSLPNASGRFPAVESLRAVVSALPAEVAMLIVFPPVYVPSTSEGTAWGQGNRACKDAFVKLASERPHMEVVDWRVDRPQTRNPELFFDQTHYRQPLAQLIEADIAAKLGRLSRAP